MPAERGKPRRKPSARSSHGSALMSDRSGLPVVVRIDQETADRFRISLDRLREIVAAGRRAGRIREWPGRHADGSPVYQLRELEPLVAEEVTSGAPS